MEGFLLVYTVGLRSLPVLNLVGLEGGSEVPLSRDGGDASAIIGNEVCLFSFEDLLAFMLHVLVARRCRIIG